MPGMGDLSGLFIGDDEQPVLEYGQGRVLAWDPATGENVIDRFGTPLTNVHVFKGIDALTIRENDLVGMFGWTSPSGVSTWWVLGTIAAPGTGATDLVVRGGSIFIEDQSLFVRGNGGITIQDGASLVAQYPTGEPALYFGRLLDAVTLLPLGNGMLTRRLNGDIIAQMYEADDGVAIVGFDANRFDVDTTGDVTFDSGAHFYVDSTTLSQVLSDGQAGLGGTAGTYLLRQDGGAVTANVHMATDGQILRVGSTERIKRDILDFNPDIDAVLQMRPRSWLPGAVERVCPPWIHDQHKDGVECHAGEEIDPPEGAPRQVGFIAEELDGLGLSEFVEYGEDGLPISILYDRLTVAMVPLAQEQQARIDTLTTQLEALAARVAALEPPKESPDGD
jgi:hypothetical protein